MQNEPTKPPSPAQYSLQLHVLPHKVRAHGLRGAHPRPLVSLGKQDGKPFTSWRVAPDRAWGFPELEYANAGSSLAAIVLDCDTPAETARGLFELPPANWIVRRVSNGHAHIAWTLADPVHRYPAARIEPLRFLTSIAEYYAHATGADPGYAGILAHNPTPRYRNADFQTAWGREAPYTLDQLATVIPFNWEPPKVRQTSVGRAVDLFEAGMRWAGKRANEHLPLLPALMSTNQEFAHPLPLSEVQATGRSIEKFRKQWAARGWHCPSWLAKQAARGRKAKGKARKRSASPGGSNEVLKPWEAEGISRRTWYRRRVALKANTDKLPF